MRRIFPIIFLMVYLVVRFLLTGWLNSLGTWASMLFELGFVICILAYYHKQVKLFGALKLRWILEIIGCGILGFLIYKLAPVIGVRVPFDLEETQIIFELILLGPLLEELLFRGALWYCLKDLFPNNRVVLFTTSALFAWGHFFAFFFVPIEIGQFVIFQTIYTFLVSLWWGKRFISSGALSTPAIYHIVFNLGFFIASQY